MVEAPGYFFDNCSDISVTGWARSNLITALCVFNSDEINAENAMSQTLVEKLYMIWKMVEAPEYCFDKSIDIFAIVWDKANLKTFIYEFNCGQSKTTIGIALSLTLGKINICFVKMVDAPGYF
jgi:hypothetical protein